MTDAVDYAIGEPVRLQATTTEAARAEAHDVHRWHVLGKAPSGTVAEGTPDGRCGWCVRGSRRALIFKHWGDYMLQEFKLVARVDDARATLD